MSIYRSAKSPFWQYDFEIGGHRFHGSTKCTTKREAEEVVRAEREKAERFVKQAKAAATSLRLDDIADRYMQEVGHFHKGADNTERQIAYVIEFLGPDRLITDITGDDVAKLVAWRRGHRTSKGEFISSFTVNDTTEQLKKLFTRAKEWCVHFDREPKWKNHWLKEPQERVRELHDDEAERLDDAMRADYAPFFAFAEVSGLRLRECLLRWEELKWDAKPKPQIIKRGKGDNWVKVEITPTIRDILWPLRGHHAAFVFTYKAQRTRDGRVKGERYPLTYQGVKTAWRRGRKRSGVVDFRFHDYRHNLGTKALRETGNLKLVQKMLNHADLKTTSRYAHVLDEEVAAAMERVSRSRKKSRKNLREVS